MSGTYKAIYHKPHSNGGSGPSGDGFQIDVAPVAANRIKQALLAAFDIQVLYNNDMNRTIWATLTSHCRGPAGQPRTDDTHSAIPAQGTFHIRLPALVGHPAVIRRRVPGSEMAS